MRLVERELNVASSLCLSFLNATMIIQKRIFNNSVGLMDFKFYFFPFIIFKYNCIEIHVLKASNYQVPFMFKQGSHYQK